MWVADMDFQTAPEILEALHSCVSHGIFGYTDTKKDYFDALANWEKTYFDWDIEQDWLLQTPGVVNAIATGVRALTSPGDAVLITRPVYYPFSLAAKLTGRRLVNNALIRKEDTYEMDFAGLEEMARDPRNKVLIFCNPHNPVGRVWSREELERLVEICAANHVFIIDDEIHNDLIMPGYRHTALPAVSPEASRICAYCTAPSKTFNLAGLVGSYHIIYNPWLRERVDKESALCRYNEMNVLSMHALTAAYSQEGVEWLDELRQVLAGNVDFACDYIAQRFEGVKVAKPQGTYMLFLDCADWCAAHGKTIDQLERMGWDVGVAWQDGRMFHGPCHIRVNLALPLSRVEEAFRRLDRYVFNA